MGHGQHRPWIFRTPEEMPMSILPMVLHRSKIGVTQSQLLKKFYVRRQLCNGAKFP